MIEVVPAIIPESREQLEMEISKVSSFAELVQVDISDGIFTPVKTWPYNGKDKDFFEELKNQNIGWPKWEDLDIELHLMVVSPENVLADWIKTGVSAVVAHVEATKDFQKVIDICKDNGVKIGIAIKPSTDNSSILPFVDHADFIQVMGSDNLGRHGENLDPKAALKIKSLQALYPERIIAIDIGVMEDTEDLLVSSGADKLVSGGAILNAANPEEEFKRLEHFNDK